MKYIECYDEIRKTVLNILKNQIGSGNAENTIDCDDSLIEAIINLETAINENVNYFTIRDEVIAELENSGKQYDDSIIDSMIERRI